MTDHTPRYFIPAAPGFWVLRLCEIASTGGYLSDRTPVVAWEMRPLDEDKPERDCFAVPVTTDWELSNLHHEPVLGPDGLVRIPGGATWDSEGRWLEDEAAKDRAARNLKETA